MEREIRGVSRNPTVAAFNQAGIGQMLPIAVALIAVSKKATISGNPPIAIAVAGWFAGAAGGFAVGTGGHFAPEGRSVRHIARQRHVFIAKTQGRRLITLQIYRYTPQLRRADERLAGKHAPGKQAEDDQHDGQFDQGEGVRMEAVAWHSVSPAEGEGCVENTIANKPLKIR